MQSNGMQSVPGGILQWEVVVTGDLFAEDDAVRDHRLTSKLLAVIAKAVLLIGNDVLTLTPLGGSPNVGDIDPATCFISEGCFVELRLMLTAPDGNRYSIGEHAFLTIALMEVQLPIRAYGKRTGAIPSEAAH